MKPLIFILLTAISAQAQSLADVARSERIRRAQAASSRVFTTEDVRALSTPLSTTPPVTTPSEAAPAVSERPAAPEAVPAAPQGVPEAPPAVPVDPILKYNEDLGKIRGLARELQDRETGLQLQLNDLNNRFFAPVTDQQSRTEAQTRIADIQKQLESVRRELTDTRAKLQQMVLLGPRK